MFWVLSHGSREEELLKRGDGRTQVLGEELESLVTLYV